MNVPLEKYLEQRAMMLKLFCMHMVKHPVYQAGVRDSYFCNISFYDAAQNDETIGWKTKTGDGTYQLGNVFDVYNYQIDPVLRKPETKGNLSTSIPYIYSAIRSAADTETVKLHSSASAQALANCGTLLCGISQKYNHVITLCADIEFRTRKITGYQPTKGVFTGNVGKYCGMMYASDNKCFGNKYNDPEILYVEFKNDNGVFESDVINKLGVSL